MRNREVELHISKICPLTRKRRLKKTLNQTEKSQKAYPFVVILAKRQVALGLNGLCG